MNSLLRGEIFKKKSELPPEPELLSSVQIYEDLSIAHKDSIYTNDVTDTITVHDPTDSNLKTENFSPKSFDMIDKILKAKEDIIVQKKSLAEQIDKLHIFASDLKVTQESFQMKKG